VLSGADGWEAIEEFGKAKLDWLRKFAPFIHGIPSHDCIAYVVSRLRPKAFQECFVSWMRALAEATGGELVALDGKTARGSRARRRGTSALHMVSAWGCRNRLVLWQEATAEKFKPRTRETSSPVPKSSIESLTPRAFNPAIFAVALWRSPIKTPSVISKVSRY